MDDIVTEICYKLICAERMINNIDSMWVKLTLSKPGCPQYEDDIRDPLLIDAIKDRYRDKIKELHAELNKELDKF